MAPSFIISVLGVIWAALMRFDAWKVARGFLLLGALTVFFDFLDNPILTLGMPLCILVWRLFEADHAVAHTVKIVCLSSLCWFVGYGSIWLSKFVLATLVLGENVVENGFGAALLRLGVADQSAYTGGSIVIESLVRNITRSNTAILLCVALLLVVLSLVASSIQRGGEEVRARMRDIVPFLIVACLPYIWFIAASNHSFEHHWFTYRDQIVTVFALLLCAQLVLRSPRRGNSLCRRLKDRCQHAHAFDGLRETL